MRRPWCAAVLVCWLPAISTAAIRPPPREAPAPARTAPRERQQAAEDPAVAAAGADETYSALLDVGFDVSGAVAVAGVALSRGPARLFLDDGTWIPLVEVAGSVTGGVFLGSGRIAYGPPSGVEQDQLEKFTDERTLEEPFERLYLRFSDGAAAAIAAATTPVDDVTPTQARVRVQAAAEGLVADAARLHEQVARHFLEEERYDLESRLFADLVDGQTGFFLAWAVADGGPLLFTQDAEADDLFSLRGWSTRGRRFDRWGGFGGRREAPVQPLHYELEMTLDGDDLEAARARVELEPRRPTRVLRFSVHPALEIDEVTDQDGRSLFFARRRSEGDDFNEHVTVVLDQPLAVGTPASLTFTYTGDIVDTPWGGGVYALRTSTGWYPTIGYLQRSTYDMTFRVDADDEIFAAGERVSDEVVDGVRVARFEQKLPVALVSFNYGSMETREIEVEGAPPITVFGTATGIGGDMLGNVGADVGNALVFFSRLFGNYPFTYMSATLIPYSHGQGFPGLLHLARSSFNTERRGHTEAFRGHETAHQWWGHMVGWETYRDQWISEGFASYSGALYAEAYLDDPEVLDEMTDAWRNDVFNRGNAGFQAFGMPAGLMQRASEGSWSGPITIGYRLTATETPADYAMLAYEKGAYVLHMLRMAMYDWPSGSDEPWRAMMRDFVASHLGAEATTESFRAVVERHFGEDMGWFFDQWVYGTAVPTYRFAWRTENAIDGSRSLRLRVRQSVEPDVELRMFVPVRVDLAEDRFVVLRVLVDESTEEFEFDLPAGLDVESVTFNPRNAVLAMVEEEGW